MVFRASGLCLRVGRIQSLDLLHLVQIISFHGSVAEHCLILHLHDFRIVLLLSDHKLLLLQEVC